MRSRPTPSPAPSVWDELSSRLEAGLAKIAIGPVTDRHRLLTSLGLTEQSTLGALVANCGGVTIDHGWLRLHAGGASRMASLLDANIDSGHSMSDHLIVAHDVVGGRFAINGTGGRGAPGEVCYLAPDTLEWLALGMGHTAFVEWALGDSLGQFYQDLRWPGWEREVEELEPDQALTLYPPPFAAEGHDIAKTARRAVPAAELFTFLDDAAHQLRDLPPGRAFEIRFDA